MQILYVAALALLLPAAAHADTWLLCRDQRVADELAGDARSGDLTKAYAPVSARARILLGVFNDYTRPHGRPACVTQTTITEPARVERGTKDKGVEVDRWFDPAWSPGERYQREMWVVHISR